MYYSLAPLTRRNIGSFVTIDFDPEQFEVLIKLQKFKWRTKVMPFKVKIFKFFSNNTSSSKDFLQYQECNSRYIIIIHFYWYFAIVIRLGYIRLGYYLS